MHVITFLKYRIPCDIGDCAQPLAARGLSNAHGEACSSEQATISKLAAIISSAAPVRRFDQ